MTASPSLPISKSGFIVCLAFSIGIFILDKSLVSVWLFKYPLVSSPNISPLSRAT